MIHLRNFLLEVFALLSEERVGKFISEEADKKAEENLFAINLWHENFISMLIDYFASRSLTFKSSMIFILRMFRFASFAQGKSCSFAQKHNDKLCVHTRLAS